MLAPLYDISTLTAAVTVAAPGAAATDVDVPVVALTASMPTGTILDFGSAKFAKLSASAAVDDESLSVEALPTSLVAGDDATYRLPAAHPLLSEKWANLGGPNATTQQRADQQTALQVSAEMILGLRAPVYTGDDAQELAYAIVLQLNFMLEHGITPSVVKSSGDTNRGVTTTYRDRWIDPNAAVIVSRVTGVQQVRFTPSLAGV